MGIEPSADRGAAEGKAAAAFDGRFNRPGTALVLRRPYGSQ